jgi:hypothetical protein
MLKTERTLATAWTPATEGTSTTLVTPGAEWMLNPSNRRKANSRIHAINSRDATAEKTTTTWKHQDQNSDVNNSMIQ